MTNGLLVAYCVKIPNTLVSLYRDSNVARAIRYALIASECQIFCDSAIDNYFYLFLTA